MTTPTSIMQGVEYSSTMEFLLALHANHPDLYGKVPQMFMDQANRVMPQGQYWPVFHLSSEMFTDPTRYFSMLITDIKDTGAAFNIKLALSCITTNPARGKHFRDLVPMRTGAGGEQTASNQAWFSLNSLYSPFDYEFCEELRLDVAKLKEQSVKMQELKSQYGNNFTLGKSDFSAFNLYLRPASVNSGFQFHFAIRVNPTANTFSLGMEGLRFCGDFELLQQGYGGAQGKPVGRAIDLGMAPTSQPMQPPAPVQQHVAPPAPMQPPAPVYQAPAPTQGLPPMPGVNNGFGGLPNVNGY